MSLKAALLELKELMQSQRGAQLGEKEISEIEGQYGLAKGTLVFYYNNMLLLRLNQSQDSDETGTGAKKVNRKWTKTEVNFMFHYIKERQNEGALNITEILEEVAGLLNRGYQSVNYKYYTLSKEKVKKEKLNQNKYEFVTIPESDLPVVSTEIISDNGQNRKPVAVNNASLRADNTDLLDVLSGLISNVEQLPGLNLNELLRSLYQLTNMALMNQDAVREIESIKSEISSEKDMLQDKLKKREQQLMLEKRRNDELQGEVAKLAREIHAFNQLGDAAKIQNLKSYNQRLNYIIDSFGVVLQVGS